MQASGGIGMTGRGILSSLFSLIALVTVIGCSSGGGSRDEGSAPGGSDAGNFGCSGACGAERLEIAEVNSIISQGITTANALGVNATFAIVDRVGNVLALYRMPGAVEVDRLDGAKGATGGLEGVTLPAVLAAISKAGTGAYLSSQGNAFSTRTASLIVQENFLPGERQAPGGPLFGVQFSQFVCSDVTVVNRALASGIPFPLKETAGGLIGPRPLPLGLSGDPGGFPLYQNGDLVGGIGVEIDGVYTIDPQPRDTENSLEELVALGASRGFQAPSERTANNISVAGKTLAYSDVGNDDLPPLPELFAVPNPASFVPLPLYTDGTVRDGARFGLPESGYMKSARAGVATLELVNEQGGLRFPVRSGRALPGGIELSATEVGALLDSAIHTASRARAAIRRPLDSAARVSIFVIDDSGIPLGFTRSEDAPVFGTDVSLQKARGAVLISSGNAGALLSNIPSAGLPGRFVNYGAQAAAFLGVGLDGAFAFSARAIGNLARPFYPDGINGNGPGPFSISFPGSGDGTRSWSPLNDGLQLDLSFLGLVGPISAPPKIPSTCMDARFGKLGGNGIQIFAGGVPLYRNGVLIGGIGVSGDGIDQDDMVAFFGSSRRGLDEAGHTTVGDPVLGFNAPPDRRSDRITPPGSDARLRYVNCPEAPFIGSDEQNVCSGL